MAQRRHRSPKQSRIDKLLNRYTLVFDLGAEDVDLSPHARIQRMPVIPTIIKGIDELRTELSEIRQSNRSDEGLRDAKLITWTRRTYEMLKGWGFTTEAELGFGRNSVINMHDGVDIRAKMRDDKLKALRDDVSSHPEHYESKLSATGQSEVTQVVPRPHRVFLGHGHNKLWARVHMFLKDELHLDVEVWESNPRTGLHSIDVLKDFLKSCTFAVIVATGEDTTAAGEVRARQNVVHEIGLFQGSLGFEKVALLQQEGVEEFSNIAGLQVVLFPDDRIESTFYELQRMLKREKIIK
jgi:predicted nucleotide-binding protein